MSVRCVKTLWTLTSRRQFQTSVLRLSADIFHVKNDEDFKEQVLKSKNPTIVDFHATWCGPCKVLDPRLTKVIAEYNKKAQSASGEQIKLAKVDIDDLAELSGKYNVQAVPTVVAIKNGEEITRFTGAADENRIKKMIDQLSH